MKSWGQLKYFACAALLGACLIGAPKIGVIPIAQAQETSPTNQQDARAEWEELNDQLIAAYRDGKYADGVPPALAALALAETAFGAEHPDTLTSVNNLAALYRAQGLYGQAEPLYLRALEASERVLGKEHPDTLNSVNNLAYVYNAQGLYGQAEPLYLRALEARERVLGKEHPDTLSSVNNLAYVYNVQGLYGQAEPLYLRALEASERVLGKEHPDTLISVNNLAALYDDQGLYGQAEPLYLRALEARERVLGKEHPDTLISVNNLAALYDIQGLYAQAEPLYLRLLTIAERTLGQHHVNMATYYSNQANLLHAGFDAAPAAIYYQKRAVNVIQSVRAELSELQESTQSAFLEKNRFRYETLQQWLIEAGRFAEAEQVGRMLKEQEYFEFIRRRAIGDDPRDSRIGLSSRETEWQAQIEALAARPNALAAERNALQALDTLDETQTAQLESLKVAYSAAYKDYREGLTAWRTEISALEDAKLSAETKAVNDALTREQRRQIAAAGADVALLQIVPLKEDLHFFLTTPTAFVHESVPAKRTDLLTLIGETRASITLGDPSRAGGPASGGSADATELYNQLSKLHEQLIAPIEQHLDDAGTQTLILNLQGALRYAPMAALYDAARADRQHLTERYRLVLYTPNGLNTGEASSAPTGARGFGVSQQHGTFSALPAVRTEMDAIFHWEDGQGVFTGTPAVDTDFTRDALASGLSDAPGIVHIASHFSLQPGDTDKSFLLLGDGNPLSLSEFSYSEDLRFDGVDLLTLSACSTALGGDGAEIDSFGAMAQDLGAQAVVATLWNVADDATASLMTGFYSGYATGGLSRAEALRQAQVDLIKSEDRSHPYYWAPFILMGDWR